MDNAEDLFMWIGDCIAEVVRDSVSAALLKEEALSKNLIYGITFSFPMMYELFH
jgi:hexokinase